MSFITFPNPEKIQYGCHWDSASRPKAECRPCRGTLYLGALQQVFFLKHVVRPSKKVQGCICNPRQNTPNFTLNPKIWLLKTKHPMTSDNSAEVVKMLLC